jgi:rubredoxin
LVAAFVFYKPSYAPFIATFSTVDSFQRLKDDLFDLFNRLMIGTYEFSQMVQKSYIARLKQRRITVKKWKCSVCGYVYDPEKGVLLDGIKPGTPFENIPEKWVCPICGASKTDFHIHP